MRSLVEQNVTCRLSSALEQRSGSRQDAIPLGPPAFFGAQCIYGESVRARTVSAVTPAELLEVKTNAIFELSRHSEFVRDAMKKHQQGVRASRREVGKIAQYLGHSIVVYMR